MHEGVAVHKLTFSGDVPDDYIVLDVNRRYEEIFSLKREDVTNRLGTDVFRLPVAPYLKESQACLKEGIAGDEDLTDAGLIFGTGFAPFRGGPLNYLKTHPLKS